MGVRFDQDEQRFVFDFEHDGAADIVSLTGDGYEVEAFGRCFYQGNNRVVVAHDGTVEQQNDYYAYGGPWGDTSTNQGFQPFKYNGKELDRVHGLDWYDYGARRYDPAFAQFTQMDPLCEKYPHLSPYAYCAGNPVRYVDPDGMDWIYVRYGSDIFYFFDERIKSQEDVSNYYYGGSSENNKIQYYGSAGSPA